ncbi:uncharacterized protein LOC142987852 [Anticarsia gemmatalis]|uniref:uncharacterized protein LOC142987852 n=1 Tax=Anticarsia gemmatalis TaxID=129554 RepID=UPI003F76B075
MALVYSCCFWFSLRLGGILIGLFSLFQALVLLIMCCLGYGHIQLVKDEISNWSNGLNLIYAKSYLESIQEDPQKYFSLIITFTCIYIIVCLLFIYGAYTCNNMLMVTYIILEFLRLILISTLVATCLLLIKQNTMDIGLLIGASVAGGFLLLGMFYLWICAANLPIVINEMERDEQAAVINKLRQVLESNNQRSVPRGIDRVSFSPEPGYTLNKGVFVVPRNKDVTIHKRLSSNSRIPRPFVNGFH